MRGYIRVLRDNPDYARLWGANVVSLLGDWFNAIVLSALVATNSPGSEGTAIALFLLARFLPPMLVSPFAGVLIDSLDRKKLLIWSSLLRGAVVMCYLFVINDPSLLWLVYVLMTIQSFLSAVTEPGQSALIPSLVPARDLLHATTLFNITWSVMLALGSAVGGVVASLFGAGTALFIDAGTFVLGAWLIHRIKGYTYTKPTGEHHKSEQGIMEGVRYLRRTPSVASLLLVKFGGSIGNVDALMTIFATQIFVLGVSGQLSLGIMYTVYGIGSILGPILLNRLHRGDVGRMRAVLIIGFMFMAVGWLVMGWSPTLVVLCIGLILRAMGGSANWTYSTVIIQKTTPDAYLGRVFSIDMMGFYLATVISTLIHGALVDIVGAQRVRDVSLWTFAPAIIMLVIWTVVQRVVRVPAPTPKPASAD